MVKIPEDQYNKVHQEAQRERSRVGGQIDALLCLSAEQQLETVRFAFRSFRSPAAVRELLRRSREQCLRDHEKSLWFAHLAHLVALRFSINDDRIASDRITYDYQALALAQQANACRIGSRWQKATELMNEAFLLHHQGSGDVEVHARLCSLRGSLFKDRRRHGEALTDLQVARTIYRQLADQGKLIDVLLKTALVHSLLGEHEFAFRLNSEAIRFIDEDEQPLAAATANCNEALFLTEMGEPKVALQSLRLFPAFTELGIPSDTTLYAYRKWQIGKAKLALGYFRSARELLEEVRLFFINTRIPFNQALVTLDLAQLYFRAHKTDRKAYEAAFEAVNLLKQQSLDQEASRAVGLLAKAIYERILTVSRIRHCIDMLRGGRPPTCVWKC